MVKLLFLIIGSSVFMGLLMAVLEIWLDRSDWREEARARKQFEEQMKKRAKLLGVNKQIFK